FLALSPQIAQCADLQAGCAFATRILGFVNAPSLMQHLAASLQDVTIDLDWYRRRRDRLYNALSSMGYAMPYPDGAFYLFVKVPWPEGDDFAFVNALREDRVLTVPGSGFGYPGYFRIAYCVSENSIEASLDVFAKLVKK
ncbi:MAG: aminotransferase class I/II-fold pyridoxal phosphate-dependent enzyme, partial [Deltaproteobacteria bacterium]|nr:aminotransferase class I/II-fold pyridoxal phosphate-dependent enzyme [Deltaproteobacteria bacterium]